jgi:DNA-binding winged helix-turn-helix (wHTH) protein/Tol biopolymer transport system component
VDLEAGELCRNGRKVRLAGQPFQILAILLEQPGRVVTREELQKRLWPDTVVEVEHSLNTAVNKIREALDDTADNPRFVETLPRRGYRFIAPIWAPPEAGAMGSGRQAEGTAATTPPEPERADSVPADPRIRSPRRWVLLGAGAALFAALAVVVWILRSPHPLPRITDYAQLTNDGRARAIGGTDGIKLFVNTFEPDGLAQISISDGRSVPFRIEVPDAKHCSSNVPTIRDVSLDGSQLLVLCLVRFPEFEVWVVGAIGCPSRLLTSAQDAAWSPDGKSVVYSAPDGSIYRIPGEGGEAHLLLPARVQKGQIIFLRDLVWSPNGDAIRFTREGVIWEIAANGGNLHRLLPPDRWKLGSCCGRWTPDGDFFIFIYGDSPFAQVVSEHGAQLWALDERRGLSRLRHAEPIQLASPPVRWADAVPSRDGRHIFARGITVRGELARYDVKLKQLQSFLGGPSATELAFSRDGKFVAYVSFPEGILWSANRDGSDIVQLTQLSKSPPAMPNWSPDGKEIVYVTAPSGHKNAVMSVPSRGGAPRELLSEGNDSYNDPSWSPDGKRIVFASAPLEVEKEPVRIGEICIKILDRTSRQTSVLPGSALTYSPRWSPDGRYIAGLTALGQELRVYDLKSEKWLPLAKSQANYPAWSRDSRYVYGLTAGEKIEVHRTPISGGPPELVVDLTGVQQTGWWGFWFGLDPTDAPLILRDAGAYEIYSLTLDRE